MDAATVAWKMPPRPTRLLSSLSVAGARWSPCFLCWKSSRSHIYLALLAMFINGSEARILRQRIHNEYDSSSVSKRIKLPCSFASCTNSRPKTRQKMQADTLFVDGDMYEAHCQHQGILSSPRFDAADVASEILSQRGLEMDVTRDAA